MSTKSRTHTDKMAASTSAYLTAPSPSAIDTLSHLSTLLHLLHHRNKNQHRLAIWYRHFSTLRRHLSRLVTHYTTLLSVPETHAARHRKKAQDVATRSKIVDELDFWTETLVGKWCAAFSQLAADLRFGVLGVFLLAVVGEVAGITGVTAMLEERGEREVLEAIERFGREFEEDEGLGQRQRVDGGEEDFGEVLAREAGEGNEDQGEAVEREQSADIEDAEIGEVEDLVPEAEELVDLESAVVAPSVGDALPSGVTEKRARPADVVESRDEQVKKKKKRRKNAIDELFGSL